MKVKTLIKELKNVNPNANIWIDLPYLKKKYSRYDICISDFKVKEVFDKVDMNTYIELTSNQTLYDYFRDIYIPIKNLTR